MKLDENTNKPNKPNNPGMVNISLEELIKMNSDYHMNTYGRLPVSFVRGKGMKLWDTEGKEYLDFLSGIGVVSVGHCHPFVIDAIKSQVERLMHVSNLYYIEPQLRLAKKIVEISFGDKCFFANSGAEANEGAIKLARRYAKLKGSSSYEIITALGSFHGRTMKTLAATGQPDKQKPFEPIPPGFKHVPLNDIEALKNEVGDITCAVMLEVIQGESGVNLCDRKYLEEVRELCDELDILLIFDEVQTGMGRTGNMFAYQAYGVTPDVMTLAKGIGSGLPIGVLVASDKASSFRPGEHGSTFGGGPLVCAGALATIKVIEDEGLVKNAAQVGEYFKNRLCSLQEDTGIIKEVRGQGLMLAIELEENKAGMISARDMVLNLLNEGLVANNIGNSIIRFLPPLCITQNEVDRMIAVLERLLTS
jgi:acetylornithine/N-succinyldiaminopimelate aminotransferase